MIKLCSVLSLLTLTACCKPANKTSFDTQFDNLKYNQTYVVDHGFYQGCKATLKGRTTYFGLISDLKCPSDYGTTLTNIEIDARSLFKEQTDG